MTTKTIVTSQPDVACDVCGRGLLRGERPDVYVGGGRRRTVCELCAPRATQEGWRRESAQAAVEHGETGRRGRGAARGRSLLGRLGLAGGERGARPVRAARGESAQAEGDRRPLADASVLDEQWDDIGAHWTAAGRADDAIAADGAAPTSDGDVVDVPGSTGGNGRAEAGTPADATVGTPAEVLPEAPAEVATELPTDAAAEAPADAAAAARVEAHADLARALEVFNAGEHPRRIAGVTRALGPATLKVAPVADVPRTVAVIAAWELCWYRYEVDLDDEAAGARLAAEGTELEELPAADREPNAVADERGELALLAG